MIPNHQIILIGGYPKSGTTYIQRIFDNFETEQILKHCHAPQSAIFDF